jgi:hypothetical protein
MIVDPADEGSSTPLRVDADEEGEAEGLLLDGGEPDVAVLAGL